MVLIASELPIAAALFALLYFLEPNLKAMASLNVTDADVAVWLGLTAALAWWMRRRQAGTGPWLGFGLFFLQGLSAASKITALGYLPFSYLAAAFRRVRFWVGLAGFFAALLIAYHFHVREIEWFFAAIGFQFKHNHQGQASLFLGKYPDGGTIFFFLVLYFLKLPIPTLIMTVVAGAWAIRKRREFKNEWLTFFIPALLMGAALSLARVQLGFRYFLPALVLIELGTAIVIGAAVSQLRESPRGLALAVFTLSVFAVALAVTDLRTIAEDSYLTYFNPLERAPTRDFCDSNNDWGQGVPGHLRADIASAMPAERLSERELALRTGDGPVEIIAGASYLCAASKREGWILRELKPERVVAGYEVFKLSRPDALDLAKRLDSARAR